MNSRFITARDTLMHPLVGFVRPAASRECTWMKIALPLPGTIGDVLYDVVSANSYGPAVAMRCRSSFGAAQRVRLINVL